MTQNDLKQVEEASAEQETQVLALRSDVDKIEIVDQGSYEGAATLLKMVKARKVFIEDERKNLKAPVLETGRRIDTLFKKPLDACSMAENALKMKIGEFLKAEERKRLEQERIAREKADKERVRLENLAMKAEERGDIKKADQFAERRDLVEEEPVVPAVEKVPGIRQTETWRAELVDLMLIVKAAATGENPHALDCLSFNQAEANRKARFFKDKMQIPGLKAVKETGIAASTRG